MSQVRPGCYPAAVTPFDAHGDPDPAGMARLLAWFESQGCTGAVLCGTNGEGPSLSAIEKRDMLKQSGHARGGLDLILGIATPALTEAVWLCKQATDYGAVAALVMPPSYFTEAGPDGIVGWFSELMDRSPLPILVYNFPKRTGITIRGETLRRLAGHDRMAGAKDSSGERANLESYAAALNGKSLFVGNETLLLEAMAHGWSGTISGAANVLPGFLSAVVDLVNRGKLEEAEGKFRLILPAIEAIRRQAQPAGNKAVLERLGILESGRVRLPLVQDVDLASLWPILHGLVPREPVQSA